MAKASVKGTPKKSSKARKKPVLKVLGATARKERSDKIATKIKRNRAIAAEIADGKIESPFDQRTKNGNKSWNNHYVYLGYECASKGMSDQAICEMFGISLARLRKWYDKYPELHFGVLRAREASKYENGFQNYVYKRLPEELIPVWEEILMLKKSKAPTYQLEQLLQKQGTVGRQRLFIHALVHNRFNVSESLKSVNVALNEYKKWLDKDPVFAELVNEVQFHKKNFVEGGLMDLVAMGDKHAIMFANKALNSDRGYGDKLSVEHSGTINHNVSGQIDVMQLDLPDEVFRLILEAHRKQQNMKITEIKKISGEVAANEYADHIIDVESELVERVSNV